MMICLFYEVTSLFCTNHYDDDDNRRPPVYSDNPCVRVSQAGACSSMMLCIIYMCECKWLEATSPTTGDHVVDDGVQISII